jgi:uncharacterized protein (TIGR02145 family)
LQIRLLTKSVDGTINSSVGGTVAIQNGSVSLPANGVLLNNAPYSGTVNVAIKHFDPMSTNFSDEMPGSLVGVTNDSVSGLTSYGMLGVELTDNSGHLLQIANGKTATLTFKVPASLQASAPSSIDLWSLDEVKGYWVKEGVATLVNNVYTGQVSHFSFWNCDVSTDFVYINGQIINSQTQQPLQGATITISSPNFGSRNDLTNSQGQFSGAVPNGVGLSITVSVNCSGSQTVVYNGNLPAMSTNTTIAAIAVSLPGQTILTGTVVGCTNQPLANSYILVNNQAFFTSNGHFNAAVCGSNCTVQAFGSNPWVSGQSQQITLMGGSQNIGNLAACNPIAGTVTDIDGNVYSTVVIGNQEWMQENLKTTHYKNGAVIPLITDSAIWEYASTGASANLNNDLTNVAVYGKLYNWYAVADPQGLCPSGWHVPENWEWYKLFTTLDSNADTISGGVIPSGIAGGSMKEVGLSHWQSPNAGATNSSGFTGLPGGYRDVLGIYDAYGSSAFWWSSTNYNSFFPNAVCVFYDEEIVELTDLFEMTEGLSVRCVKN